MAAGTGSSRCRWCAQPIKWAHTEKGKAIPLDPDPVPDNGNIELINGIAYVMPPSHDPADVRHVSHFATCTQRPNRRKR